MTEITAVFIVGFISLIVGVINTFALANFYYKIKMNEIKLKQLSSMSSILEKANENIVNLSKKIEYLGKDRKKDLVEDLKWSERFNQTVMILKTFNDRLTEIESIVK